MEECVTERRGSRGAADEEAVARMGQQPAGGLEAAVAQRRECGRQRGNGRCGGGFGGSGRGGATWGKHARGPAAEALLEGAKYDAELEGAAEASEAAAVAGVRLPRPADRVTMTRSKRQRWKQRGGRPRLDSDRGGI